VEQERSLSELLELHSKLQEQFNKANTPENRAVALKDVRNLVKFFEITSAELEGCLKMVRKPRGTGTRAKSKNTSDSQASSENKEEQAT